MSSSSQARTAITFSRRVFVRRAAMLLAAPALLGALEACSPAAPAAPAPR